MVVVPTGAKIEDVVEAVPEKVVEPVPVPNVEVKQPKKEKNKKKTTIEIQEVETIPEPKEVVDAAPAPPVEAAPVVEKEVEKETVAVVETVKVTNVKSSPTKQKNKKEKPIPTETAAPPSPKELLTIVKKTSFNDAEAQKLIDLLLTKQSGDALNTSDEWIEKGKPTETQKLKQELGELEEVLKEERMKNKSFTDKFSAMKRELNDERAAKANHNRIIDEIQKTRQQEVTNINNRLQQVITENNILQGNLKKFSFFFSHKSDSRNSVVR